MAAGRGHARGEDLPRDVYADLVDTLFGTVGSFLSGIFGGLLVPAVAWFRTGEPVFVFATAVILVFAMFRVATLLRYRKVPAAVRGEQAARWEVVYAAGGVGFMLAVGLTAALMLFRPHDELTALYAVVIVLGCAGSLAGRNAGRPTIVMSQMVAVCLPVAIVLLTNDSGWSWGLAFIFLLVMTSVRSTSRFLNRMLVSALLSSREAKQQERQLSSALNSMTHGLCMVDGDGLITVINHRLREAFAIPDTASLVTLRELTTVIAERAGLLPEAADAFARTVTSGVAQPQAWDCTEEIGAQIFLFRFEPMEHGGSVVVVEDITEARRSAEQVEHLAHFDTLTGLTNRYWFQQRLEADLAAGPEGAGIVLMSIDLDRFKEVNDTLGHQLGDRLLQQVARRLTQAVRPSDIVARFGGDEFQILLRPAPAAADIDAFAARIVSTVSDPYSIDGHAMSVGASVGVALAPEHARFAEDLLKCADMALYAAKGASRGTFRRFVPELDAAAHRKRRIEQELREALATGQIEVHYQPAVDVRTGKVSTFEALARWRHPTRGMIPPIEFIPVAEETGLIADLGEFMLRQACEDASAWPSEVRVAVNVSAKQFLLRHDLTARIMLILARAGLPAHRLEIEITESVLLDANETLSALADAGIRISLDDFGTGYSSLSYLRQFQVDKIKIDRSFITVQDPISLAIIDAVSFLAESMEVDLVVEGVETQAQLDLLTARRIHLVQGYFFSQALPVGELGPLLGRGVEAAWEQGDLKIA